jgi:hypothetical protein
MQGQRMSKHSEAFDRWVRSSFMEINTELENLYFAQEDRADVTHAGDDLKTQLRDEGNDHVVKLLAEGDTGDGFATAFGVLGNVGLYLAALRRHELTNPAREVRSPFPQASSLAMHVGTALGMAPRFSTAHLAHFNFAFAGVRKSFTSLPDETLFIDENTRGIMLLQLAADALVKVVPLGISSPLVDVPFAAARNALEAVIECNQRLFARLDVDRFFYSVRPYYKPYMVGRKEYRGANAGDFSGINELDLLLGLCRANDPHYAQLLVEKMPFMPPQDQARLRECMRHQSFLDGLLELSREHAHREWFQRNVRAYLGLCALYGRIAAQHHDQLVKRFVELPANALPDAHLVSVTASGPPLTALLRSLEILRDMRLAVDRPDIASRHADLSRLWALLD